MRSTRKDDRRPVNRAGHARGDGLSEKVVWQLLQGYATAAGVPGIAPHDLRRSCAKMCRAAGGELEQIQLLLGQCLGADDRTVPRYETGSGACPNDAINLRVAV